MGKPESPTTQINVKSVRKSSWETARRHATMHDVATGSWLSDAIDQRAIRDETAIETPSNPTGKPALSASELTDRIAAVAALSNATAMLRQATGRAIGSRALGVCLKSLQRHVGLSEGLPPVRTVVGKAGGQELVVIGEAGMKLVGVGDA